LVLRTARPNGGVDGVYATTNAGDSCYVFIVNNRDRCALLPHLSAGDTAELALLEGQH
jgi:hypothetical protein